MAKKLRGIAVWKKKIMEKLRREEVLRKRVEARYGVLREELARARETQIVHERPVMESGFGNRIMNFLYGRVYFNAGQGIIPTMILLYALDFSLFRQLYWIWAAILLIIVALTMIGRFGPGKVQPYMPGARNIHSLAFIIGGTIVFFIIPSIFASPNLKPFIFLLLERIPIPLIQQIISTYQQLIWIIILTLSCLGMFMYASQMSFGGALFLTVMEIIVLFLIISPVVGFASGYLDPATRRFYLVKNCENPIFATLVPECKIIKGEVEVKPEKIVPIEGKIDVAIGQKIRERLEIPEYVVSNSTYILPITLTNDFSSPIPVQLSGFLESGYGGYFVFEAPYYACEIGSKNWCELPAKNKKSFIVKFEPEKVRVGGTTCKVPIEATINKVCGYDNTSACKPGEECLHTYPDWCECVGWSRATCDERMFFYPGVKVKFKGQFAATETFVLTRGAKPTEKTKVGFRQDNLEILPLFYPSVYDLEIYNRKEYPLTFDLEIKNKKEGILTIDSLAVRSVKKDGKPELNLTHCEDVSISKKETDYFVYYYLNLPTKTYEMRKNEKISFFCYFDVPDYDIGFGETVLINLDILMNYTYEKKVVITTAFVRTQVLVEKCNGFD
jgi:hypothetical protein